MLLRLVRSTFLVIFVLIAIAGAHAQNTDLCITKQPKPDLPPDYGTLDAQVSILLGFISWLMGRSAT